MTEPAYNLLLGGPAHGQVWATDGPTPAITMAMPPKQPPWFANPEDYPGNSDQPLQSRPVQTREGYYRIQRMVEPIGVIAVVQPRVAFGATEAWWEWRVGVWQGEWKGDPRLLEPDLEPMEQYMLALILLRCLFPRHDNMFEPPPACVEVTLRTREIDLIPTWDIHWEQVERRLQRLASY